MQVSFVNGNMNAVRKIERADAEALALLAYCVIGWRLRWIRQMQRVPEEFETSCDQTASDKKINNNEQDNDPRPIHEAVVASVRFGSPLSAAFRYRPV